MLNQEKIRLMARLAILEKEKGKELKQVRSTFKSDYIGIPMLKNLLRITAVFLLIFCIWAVGNIDFILSIVAEMQLQLLGIGVLTAYLMVIVITLIVTFLHASSRYYRSQRTFQEYQRLLEELAESYHIPE